MIGKVCICSLVVLTLIVIYRLFGTISCANDKFYDNLNKKMVHGSSMRSDQTVKETEHFDYMKEQLSDWNTQPRNKKCQLFIEDIDQPINVNDYSLVEANKPMQLFFNYKDKTMTTYFNHRYVDAGRYFNFMKAMMGSNEVVLPNLKYVPYVSELALIPYGAKMAKKLLTRVTSVPRNMSIVKHLHSIMDDTWINNVKQNLPNIKTKSIIAFLVLSHILKSIRSKGKKGSLRVIFSIGFSNKNKTYKHIGNMIGGIVIDIPYELEGLNLVKHIDKNLRKEMSQSVHSLNLQLSLPIVGALPQYARESIDMIFSISPVFKCERVPETINVLVPFIIQPLYSLVLSCNDKHFIYLASMTDWV